MYRPLTDEEITKLVDEWRPMYSIEELESLAAWKLAEQARRANQLAAALERHHPYMDDLHDDVTVALHRYRGVMP